MTATTKVDKKEKKASAVEKIQVQTFDTKEFELPDTLFVRDIEDRVFQAIILQCLSNVEGISLLEGSFFDNILGRDNVEGVKGIAAEQNSKNQAINVKVEVNISYGISIPDKATEIQSRIAKEITKFTGLHVSCVHVVFKKGFPVGLKGVFYGDRIHRGIIISHLDSVIFVSIIAI